MRDSKITFRVSEDLLNEVDSIDESRSEIMRDALRQYLDSRGTRERKTRQTSVDTIDEMITRRIEEVVESKTEDQNVNVTVNVPESRRRRVGQTEERGRRTEPERHTREPPSETEGVEVGDDGAKSCHQCGEELDSSHVYCPNCGSKASKRVFCECGDEIRSDWSFCPWCGRRTPSGHALKK